MGMTGSRRPQPLTIIIVIAAIVLAVAVPYASTALDALDEEALAVGQITPDPPTTPQPTVPCTPIDGCGRGPGTQRDVAFAWIDRYCNGDAVPTPPGMTTFAVNYGNGGQSVSPVEFFGVAEMDGQIIPTVPLNTLNPGEKDTRIRAVVVPVESTVVITITGIVVDTGDPVVFGNGTNTAVRSASGGCPEAPPASFAPPGEAPPVATPPPNVTVPVGHGLPPGW